MQLYTTKPLSESFFAEQKRENGAAGKFFYKVQPWAARNYFLFRSSVPSGPAQVRQRNALCYHRGGEHLQHCKKQGSLDVCSHTHHTVLLFILLCGR